MDTPKNIVNISGDCFNHVQVFSDGIWSKNPSESILQHSLLRFHVQLVLMMTFANSFHFVLKQFHFPRLTSDILTGIILGRTVLERYSKYASSVLFPPAPDQLLSSLSKLGYIVFAFLAAVRMDPSFIKGTGKGVFILGTFLCAFPLTMVTSARVSFEKGPEPSEAMRIGLGQNMRLYFGTITLSEFIGVSFLLMQLKITNSQLGRLSLSLSFVNELWRFGYGTLLNYMGIFRVASKYVGVQSIVIFLIVILFIVVTLRAAMLWAIRRTPEDKPMKEIYTTIVVSMLLILASVGDTVGLNPSLGPFLLGLMVPAGSPLATDLIAKLETVVSGLLVPVLSVFAATKFDLVQFCEELSSLGTFWISLIGYGLKLAATFIVAVGCKLPSREAAALTLILNVKGVIELGLFLSYTNLEARNVESSSGIFLIFLLTSLVPPLVKLLYDPTKQYIGYRKKSIQLAPNDAELHILACAHRQEDAMAAIKLLEFSNPTKQSPLSIYALCLEELVSSATPLLINHQLGQRASSSCEGSGSRSQPIIDIFNYFKSEHKKLAQVHVFTAISPNKQMHEDVCWLAFDKAVSLILLPFHKKWNSKGKLVSNSTELRNLNIDVLDRAPCSVGILVDRRRTRGLSSIFVTSTVYRVAILFLSGSDDREALAYALRMAGSPRIHITVIRFIAPQPRVHDRWEIMLDNESLRSMKHQMSSSTNINYAEKTVRDGSDTAAFVQSIQGDYDLIMVGRRHETEPEATSGLSQWTDLPELGPLGDLLASEDITSAVSILVVQQQVLKASHSSTLNS